MKSGKPSAPEKKGLHPRNRHRDRYDFPQLVKECPALGAFVFTNEYANETIDFSKPAAVKALNRALLHHFYGVTDWDIPPQYLCPPIPGRADYLHHLADLLASSNAGVIPRGPGLRGLDIGVGANCIYPLIGHREYGWRFLGSDIDRIALASATNMLQANAGLSEAIELRRQMSRGTIFSNLLKAGERFDFSMCNPPFHASPEEAAQGSRQKWRNLGKGAPKEVPVLNFGGQGHELWCPGGELEFIRTMVEESALLPVSCFWFSTLVSKSDNLPGVHRALREVEALEVRTLDMAQGQKKSRIVAWTFLTPSQQQAWRMERWGKHHKID